MVQRSLKHHTHISYCSLMPLSKELKEAILAMPASEKDKLLLRLLGKHTELQKQLEYQLLEFGESLETRRQAIKKGIDRLYAMEPDTAGWLMMDMRSYNAEISQHVKTTKDKYGEIELTLYLLMGLINKHLPLIEKYNGRNDSLAEYVVKRTDFMLKKLEKLHPDIQFDFLKDVNQLLSILPHSACAYHAREMKIPRSI